MSIVKTCVEERLRLGLGVSTPSDRGQMGVLIFRDIPAGALVTADMHRPTEIPGATDGAGGEVSDGGAGAAASAGIQPYAFELGIRPGPFTVGGVTYDRSANRLLVQSNNGILTAVQQEPAWAAFGSPQTGSLAQKGKKAHALQMPGVAGTNPNLKALDRRWLRLRWTATVVNNEILGAGTGSKKLFTGTTAGKNIAPGSMTVTATVGGQAITLRDTGTGRIVGYEATGGASADGTIDYVNGTFEIKFSTAPDNSTNVTASAYEKDCKYKPLDVRLEWDALLE